jgi:glycosyltransferase involved in cell wall biosynthesis
MSTSDAHICLVSNGFISTNPRLHKEAVALVAAGYRVTVIAQGGANAEQIASDRALIDGADFRWLPFFSGDASVYRRERLKMAAARGLARVGLRTAVLDAHALYALHAPLRRAATSVSANLYIGHNLPALPAVAAAAARHRARYAFDVEDLHVEELPDTPEHSVERALRWRVEARYLPGAAYVSAAAPLYLPWLKTRYGVAATLIRNVFPLAMAPAAYVPASGPTLYWVSQVIGPERGLEPLLAVVAQMQVPVQLVLRGRALEPFASHLRAQAIASGVQLVLLPPAAALDLPTLAAEHALALALEVEVSVNRDLCWSNKAFLGILGGTPVALSATRGQRALAEELGEAALLIDLNNPPSAAQTLDAYLRDGERQRGARAAAVALATTRLNFDVEQRVLLDLVARALAR